MAIPSVFAYESSEEAYQWLSNSTPIAGATSSNYTILVVPPGDPDGTTTETVYDGDGRSIIQTNQDDVATWFAYDGAGRLIAVTNALNQVTQYQYDEAGNEILQVDALGRTNIFTNDWLTNDQYDANGNTTNSSNVFYHYDVMNHVTNANNGQILITYDGDGNRVSKTVGSTTTYYLVDDVNPSGYAQVLEEWTNSGTTGLSKVYNYGLDLISQRQPSVSTNYIIADGHGSTRMLTDIGGTVVNALAYDAYGNLIASNGVLQTAYLYSGQQFDPDLGLYYNRARYLNTGTGRFWTMDTTEGNNEDPLSLHKYLYGADDPVNKVDPTGHDLADIEFFLSNPGYLVSMSLPETWRLLETPFGNQHGFKYELVASKDTKGGASMSTGAIVEDVAGVNGFKNDAANFGKSKGKKILRLELFGHGDPNATVGTAGYAQLALGDKVQSPFNNELMGGDFEQLFNGRFWSDAEIDLEFCHSLDVPQIPQLFKNLAPNAQIWGVHGEQNGIGE